MTKEELKIRIDQFRLFAKSANYATQHCMENPSPTVEKIMQEARLSMYVVAVAICGQLMRDLDQEEKDNEMVNQQPKKEGAE